MCSCVVEKALGGTVVMIARFGIRGTEQEQHEHLRDRAPSSVRWCPRVVRVSSWLSRLSHHVAATKVDISEVDRHIDRVGTHKHTSAR